MRMPQAVLFVLGAIGTVIAARLITREWQRVNQELDRSRVNSARLDAGHEGMADLRRDPETGVYRPKR